MACDDIAIVGFGFVLPQGVEKESTLWDVLLQGRNLMTTWPNSRLRLEAFFDHDAEHLNKLHSQGAHFLGEDPGAFDAPFFSITAKEAAAMDPQQRLVLEASYHALENAGIPVDKVRGSQTAVFSASFSDDYARILGKDPDLFPQTAATGTALSVLANRVSWYFDLLGPSVQVDTACSGSLVAIDLACQSLRNGSASMAIVTGSNLILGPERSIQLSNLGFISPDSLCHSFDHRANGYSRGEGIIAMIIKPISRAIQDGDAIRAVIRSTGSNQDGKTPSLTQPSLHSQESLIRAVYEKADLDFGLTRYFEAHGTGTPIGDPIEMEAIGRVFRQFRSVNEPLYVGSVKSNLGHLEGCSGLAGMVKAVLVLERGLIPQNALFEKINPKIDIEFLRTAVPAVNTRWPGTGLRRVSVNSFGFGGTNSHVVMDDGFHYLSSRGLRGLTRQAQLLGYAGCVSGTQATSKSQALLTNGKAEDTKAFISNAVVTSGPWRSPPLVLLVWSAPDEKSVLRVIGGYNSYCQAHGIRDLGPLAYTLSSRRSKHLWRTFAIAPLELSCYNTGFSTSRPVRSSGKAAIAFVFTGQGAQYTGMGLDLIRYPVFERALRETDSIYRKFGCTWSIIDELQNAKTIDKPQISQPLCTALQICLVELLKSFAISPVAVIGHSSGEIAAAYTIGALSLESACKVAYYRGLVAQKVLEDTSSRPGTMLSVNLPSTEVHNYLANMKLRGNIQVACVNSPANSTLSGDGEDLSLLEQQLEKDTIFCRGLKTGIAYHSSAMQPIASWYLSLISSINEGVFSDTSTTMVSTVTGKPVSPATLLAPEYWVDNLISPVNFSEAMRALLETIPHISEIVEVGPHATLQRPIKDILKHLPDNASERRYVSVLNRNQPASRSVLNLVGSLYCHGYPVSIQNANQQDWREHMSPFLLDGPAYPFDHSKSYWAESRLSSDFRLREPVPGDLLGSRVSDWNPMEPRWRSILNLNSLPWIGHHVVSDTVLLPGAAMLTMALDAVKQQCPTKHRISSYRIKDACFLKPVVISRTADHNTEITTSVRPLLRAQEKELTNFKVTLFSYHQKQWSECFNASIQIQYQEPITSLNGGIETRLAHAQVLKDYKVASKTCASAVDNRSFYKYCNDSGISFGQWFRLLNDIHWDRNATVIAQVDVAKSRYQTTSIVHPAILDSIFQSLLVPTAKTASDPVSMVPYELRDGWISATGWQTPETATLRYLARSRTKPANQGLDGTVCVINDKDQVLFEMKKVVFKTIGSGLPSHQVLERKLYGVDWRPQVSLLGPQQLSDLCHANDIALNDETIMESFHNKLDLALSRVMHITYSQLTLDELKSVPKGLQRYVDWMKFHITSKPRPAKEDLSDSKIEYLLQELEEINSSWRIFPAIARNLYSILRGETDPLQLAFNDNLAENFYSDLSDRMSDQRLRLFLGMLAHEKPNMKVLEVGAGTGSWTRHVLSFFQELERQRGSSLFSEYMFTDISGSFFQEAAENFGDFEGRLRFKVFDLNMSASEQGFNPGSYDLILAGSVLHATADLAASIRNIRQLLKPGGHLLNAEIIAPEKLATNFAFGLLPGWWLCKEPWRLLCPGVNEARWDRVLRENGFSGNDVIMRDYQNHTCHCVSLMVSTAEQSPYSHPLGLTVFLIIDAQSPRHTALARKLEDEVFTPSGCVTRTITLKDPELSYARDSEVVISFLEVGQLLLSRISDTEFEQLKAMIKAFQKILWVTSCSEDEPQFPHYGLMQGFFRSLRSEMPEKRIVSLAIQHSYLDDGTEADASYIAKVFEASFRLESQEVEYLVRNNIILTGRLVEEKEISTQAQSIYQPQQFQESWGIGPPLKLDVGTPGILDTLQYIRDEAQARQVCPDEIEIKAEAWGLSFRDIFVALGRLENDGIGIDCSGTVTQLGAACDSSGIQVGDRVLMCSPGCMRSFPRAQASAVVKLPNSLSFEVAAAIVNPAVTSYYCLVEVARLQKGESVLIHSAAGSTGQVAVLLAKSIGALVFATVGSDFKKQLMMDKFGIPAENIFNSRNTSFRQGVMRMTQGRGVDVALNSLAGDGLLASWECMAPFGRYIEIGKADITTNSPLPMANFARNVSFHAVDLWHIAQNNPTLLGRVLKGAMRLINQEAISPPTPLHIYALSDVEKAFRYLQSGNNTGRAVIQIDSSSVVQKYRTREPSWRFDKNASYLISGGLGGLGRTIIRWMIRKGARNLIVLSRSGPSSQPAAEIISESEHEGAHIVAPCCDVSNLDSLLPVLRDCARTMPPIKGCINAAMVLEDAVFENMTHPQWKRTIQSKVDTSWNLHQCLPDNLDFFIQLASLAGIYGSIAQSNYAAGCSFQDSLAHYRITRGQKAVSFDLGWMSASGIVAENEKYQRQREHAGDMHKISDQELLALLDIYCDPNLPVLSESKSQILVGVMTPADQLEAGMSDLGPAQRRPLFAGFSRRHDHTNAPTEREETPATLFKLATTHLDRAKCVIKALTERLGHALSIDPADIDISKALSEYGVDSLMAVELRNWMAADYRAPVTVFDIMGAGMDIAAIGDFITRQSDIALG
ncbi:fatty acid synthase S-acetyltransferase [Xylaria sp. FL0933]|nr:fatty acid synthase S-acetyltransferase [Xylaria sp. FL0933]